MCDDDEQEIDLERLIALQQLRIEQVRLHLDELITSTAAAKHARSVLADMLRDLATLEAAWKKRRSTRSRAMVH
jgi:hypothetical protein